MSSLKATDVYNFLLVNCIIFQVHQAIYGQEISRLPIRTFDHPELKSSIQQGDTNTIFGESKGQNVGSSQTSEEIVYENNDAIVKPNSASVSDHPIKLALNPLQKGLNQEHNSDCDYEKAFPEPGQQIKRDSIIENKKKAVQSTSMAIKKCATTNECLTNKKHTRETTSGGINIATEIQMGKWVKSAQEQVKLPPKIKPKPVMLTAKHTISDQRRTAELHEHTVVSPKPVLKAQHLWKHKKECTNNTVEDKTVSPDYENSLVNIKRAKFREAILLQKVSPPGNTNCYYGNNATDKLNKSAESVVRQSSEYEYPENVIALPKQILDQHENRHALKSEQNPKPDYANISIHSKQVSNNTESVTNDYENAHTVNELKLTKKLGQRSVSASSSGNKPFANISTGTNALLENENDEMYLPMGMATMTEDVYLPMNLDTSTDDVYLSMNVTVDDVYMPMERTDGHTQSDSESTKLLNSLGTSCHNLATGNPAAPQPCGGGVGYVNISDRQSKYVNLFRSRSTDDVSTYGEYVNFKSCTDLTQKERQIFI